MPPNGMHGKKADWRAKRDQEIDEFVSHSAQAGHPEPTTDIWEVDKGEVDKGLEQ